MAKDSSRTVRANLPHLDWRFIRQVYRVMKVPFKMQRRRATALAVALLLAVVGQKFLEYYIGLLPSHFYEVLPERNEHAFYHLLGKAIGFIIGMALAKSIAKFLANLVYVTWRRDLVVYIQNLYLKNNSFFYLNCIDRSVDNPDQRITQDVDRFCNQFSQQLPQLVISPFTIAFYSYKTWTEVGWFAPVFVYIFFLIGVVINRLLISFVVPHVVRQEKLEGDFRYHHVQLREKAEAVAFYGAGSVEGQKLLSTYQKLYETQMKIAVREFLLSISVIGFDYLGSMLSYFIIAIPILAGTYADSSLASIISKASFETLYLIYQFTQLLDLSTVFGEIAGYSHRINGLLDAVSDQDQAGGGARPGKVDGPGGTGGSRMDCVSRVVSRAGGVLKKRVGRRTGAAGSYDLPHTQTIPSPCADGAGAAGDGHDSDCDDTEDYTWQPPMDSPLPMFHLDAVSYRPPSAGRLSSLVKDLNLDILAGTGLLITGRTGTGKSSLFRALRGLWPVRGAIWQNAAGGEALYLPQRPYLTQGSLAEQVAYPDSLSHVSSRSGRRAELRDPEGGDSINATEEQMMTSSVDGISIHSTHIISPLLQDDDEEEEEESGDTVLLLEKVLSALECVGLEYLIKRAGGSILEHLDWQWYGTLSPGEAQRLAFARLLYHRPTVAFLDEATSALDDDAGHELLSACHAVGISFVAITHHRTQYEKEFFGQELRLDGKGGWSLRPL